MFSTDSAGTIKFRIINAFAKVSQKLNYFVFMLIGLLLASVLFSFAAKSYRQSQTTNMQSGTNLDTNSSTNPDTRVHQTGI